MSRYAPLWLQANPGAPLRLPRVGKLAPEDEAAVNAVISDSGGHSGTHSPAMYEGSEATSPTAPNSLFASPSSARRDSLTGRTAAPGELLEAARGCAPRAHGRSNSAQSMLAAASASSAARKSANSLPHEHSGGTLAPGKPASHSKGSRSDQLVDRLLEPARVERQRSVEHRTSWAHLQSLALRDGARSVLEALNVIRGDKVREARAWAGGCVRAWVLLSLV